MRRYSILAMVTALFLMVLPPASAGATPPVDVTIEEDTIFALPQTFPPLGALGKFTATSAGIICDDGVQEDLSAKGAGFQPPPELKWNLQAFKKFTCGDGTFTMKIQITIDKKGNNFNWVIVDGTGAYEDLHGSGKGSGTDIPGGVHNKYTGKLHTE